MSKTHELIENYEQGNSSLGVVMRCFILFSRVNGVTEYHGVVINSKEDAEKIAKSIGKSIKRFVDYREETNILNNA